MTRNVPRSMLVLAILTMVGASLWAGSGSASCAAATSARQHRPSVIRVERRAAAGFRSLVRR